MQQYIGESNFEKTTGEIILKEDKILSLIIKGNPDMELTPVSKDKFIINFKESYSVEFTRNKNGEINELIFLTPDIQVKAPKMK